MLCNFLISKFVCCNLKKMYFFLRLEQTEMSSGHAQALYDLLFKQRQGLFVYILITENRKSRKHLEYY